MSQLKTGDMCLIIGALQLSENIGKTCELIQFLQPGEMFTAPDGSRMFYPLDYGAAWVIQGDNIVGRREYNRGLSNHSVARTKGWGICYQRFLMPLRGEFEPEQQAQRQEEPA